MINSVIPPSIHQFIPPSIHFSIHPSVSSSIHPLIHPSVHYPSMHPSISPSIHQFIHPFIHPFLCSSIRTSSIHPSIISVNSSRPFMSTLSVHPSIHPFPFLHMSLVNNVGRHEILFIFFLIFNCSDFLLKGSVSFF